MAWRRKVWGTEIKARTDSRKMITRDGEAVWPLGSVSFLRHYHPLNVGSDEDGVIFLTPRMEEQRPDRMVKFAVGAKLKPI